MKVPKLERFSEVGQKTAVLVYKDRIGMSLELTTKALSASLKGERTGFTTNLILGYKELCRERNLIRSVNIHGTPRYTLKYRPGDTTGELKIDY